MNLKNYTSSVPVAQTISYLEAYLSDHPGVSAIAKEIKGGRIQSIMFQIKVDDRTHTIKLPAKIDQVLDVLWRDYCKGTIRPRKVKEDFAQQAERTAWKIQQDWVQIQMTLIRLRQADFLEVFMGYLWDGGQTYYDYLKGTKFKALPLST